MQLNRPPLAGALSELAGHELNHDSANLAVFRKAVSSPHGTTPWMRRNLFPAFTRNNRSAADPSWPAAPSTDVDETSNRRVPD